MELKNEQKNKGPRMKHGVYDGYSSEQEGSAQEVGFIYKTRMTGRTGNQFYEYAYWMLKSLHHRKVFKCTYDFPLPYPFNNAPKGFSLPSKKTVYGFDEGGGGPPSVPYYPFNIKYYENNRNLIRDIIKFEQDPRPVIDIVIHIRLDDITISHNTWDYTLLPDGYYTKCLNHYFLCYYKFMLEGTPPVVNITIVSNPIDKEQVVILNNYIKVIQGFARKGPISISSVTDTVDEDLRTISRGKVFIGSTSSFWFWPIFLSDVTKIIYFPEFGICRLMNFSEETIICKNQGSKKFIPIKFLDE